MQDKKVLSVSAQRGAAMGNDCGKMCHDCAFREGSDANNDPDAVEGALQSLSGFANFNCHKEDQHGHRTDAGRPCVGFLYATKYMASGAFLKDMKSKEHEKN